MHPGDRLHHAPVAMAEPAAVGGFHPGRVGAAVLRNRYAGIALDHAGHARGPQDFIVELAVDETLGIVEKAQRIAKMVERRGHQFEQRLGIIGGDTRVRQRRTQRARMRGLRNAAVGGDAQAFLFETDLAPLQHLPNIGVQHARGALFNYRTQWVFPR